MSSFEDSWNINDLVLFGLTWFYGISTFVDYLMPNPFLHIWTIPFETIPLSLSTQFKCKKQLYFK